MLPILPTYIHIVNPKLKHIYLGFDERGRLFVKSPKISQHKIEQLLLKKASWINSSRKNIENKKGKNVDFSLESQLYFLGKSYPLICEKHDKKNIKFSFEEGVFRLMYLHYDETLFQRHIDAFYKKEAVRYVRPLVLHWSKTMNLMPKNVSFRKTKRQWGSCSSNNNLSFNTMMMKLPHEAIEYIVVHELAHIVHKHHQPAFWELVKKYLPCYEDAKKEIKNYCT